MGQASSRVTVKTDDGTSYRSEPGAAMQIGGIQNEFEMSDQGEPIRREKYVNGMVKFTMHHMADTDLEKIRSFRDGTVIYENDTGPNYMLPNASFAEAGDLAQGKVEITFMGGTMRKQ